MVLVLLCACQSESPRPADATADASLDHPWIPDHPGAEAATLDLPPPDLAPDAGQAGEISALTYNVAGLPFGLSKSDPDKNTPLISPLLNPFDLVLIQEDFSYTTQLSSAATHPFKSSPGPPSGAILNDGLTLFSRLSFTNLARHKWTQCYGMLDHGSDCLAAKGFSVADLELAPGLVVHVYNLHMDAGQDAQDHSARAAQLLAELATRSVGAAVIVGGDTNLKRSAAVDNQGLLDKLLSQGGLTDACQALGCGDPHRPHLPPQLGDDRAPGALLEGRPELRRWPGAAALGPRGGGGADPLGRAGGRDRRGAGGRRGASRRSAGRYGCAVSLRSPPPAAMVKAMLRAIPLAALLLLAGCGSGLGSVRRVSPQELHDALAQMRAIAVDVRGASSYQLGHIKGAASVPLDEIDERAGALPRDRLIVTYCA